jgi:hypothetical protein
MTVRLTLLLSAVLALVPAAAARAAWVPTQTLDGPSPDVVKVGNVDLARDGTGALAYIRLDGGVPHVFVSRMSAGAWQAPARVDPTTGAATEAQVAVTDQNRLAVAWIADGNVYAASAPAGQAPGAMTAPVQIGGPDAHDVDIDVGVDNVAYAVWQQHGDVAAARLQDAAWTDVPSAVDINPADSAGVGTSRPRVAVGADGNAVVTWGETSDRTRVYARRLLGTALSAYPQGASSDADGGNADSPDIDIEDDSSFAWVVYRQDSGGTTHTFARHLVGSTFDPEIELDNGAPALEPRVDMTGDGTGEAVSELTDNGVLGSTLDRGAFAAPFRVDSGGGALPSKPEVATGDRGDLVQAWRNAGGGASARVKPYREPFGPETGVSNPGLGAVDDPGVFAGADRVGDFSVAMTQGPDGARAITVADFDEPPSAPFIGQSQSYKRQSRPTFSWRPGLDLWGAQTFQVLVDGKIVGQTHDATLVPAAPIAAGRHVWQVVAVDIHGQTAHSRARTLRIDSLPPNLTVKVSGKRKAGQTLKIKVTAKDVGGSGLDHVTVDYGDKSRTTSSTSTKHVYRHGKFTLKVVAVDKAGNVARKTVKLTIKK